jgi:hypothetical protein
MANRSNQPVAPEVKQSAPSQDETAGASQSESLVIAEVKLPADERQHHSRLRETLDEVRAAILKAPAGSIVVSVRIP